MQILAAKLEENKTTGLSVIRPISLMLLDFQLSQKNAVEVITELRRFIHFKNQELEDFQIQEPCFIVLTAFNNAGFKNYLKQLKIRFYEIPLEIEQLENILQESDEMAMKWNNCQLINYFLLWI